MKLIESKRKLVKVALQMIGLDGALVGAEQPSFDQGSHPSQVMQYAGAFHDVELAFETGEFE